MSQQSQYALTPLQWTAVKAACLQAGYGINADAGSISQGVWPVKTTVAWSYADGQLTVSESGAFASKAAAVIAAEIGKIE